MKKIKILAQSGYTEIYKYKDIEEFCDLYDELAHGTDNMEKISKYKNNGKYECDHSELICDIDSTGSNRNNKIFFMFYLLMKNKYEVKLFNFQD